MQWVRTIGVTVLNSLYSKKQRNDKNKQQFILNNVCKLHVHLD